MNSRTKIAAFGMIALSFAFSGNATAQTMKMKEKTVMVGGAPMSPSKNIVENAVNSKDHTTLVAAVKAAGLVETLQGKGPFTVLAPTNEAFAKLPKGTVENLVKPENKEMLTKILTYHVLAGKYSAKQIWRESYHRRCQPIKWHDSCYRHGTNALVIIQNNASIIVLFLFYKL